MTLRRIALGLAVTALVVVAALVMGAAVVERHDGAARAVESAGPEGSGPVVPGGWASVRVGSMSYAVPPAWSRRPAAERVAYREDGAVIAVGRGQAVLSAHGCPVAWAVLADPVRSTNLAGVAEATALAWARGYAGLPAGRLPVTGRGDRARVVVELGEAAGCAGERAELTAVARQHGAAVVALVVARYLDVPGAPTDAAYEGVVGSLVVE